VLVVTGGGQGIWVLRHAGGDRARPQTAAISPDDDYQQKEGMT
jgi:hypothetical protein